jgi:hypothetical protein
MLQIAVYVIVWVVLFGFVGCYVSVQCGRRAAEGFLLGCLLGPMGLFLTAILPRAGSEGRPQTRRQLDERKVSDFLGNLK